MPEKEKSHSFSNNVRALLFVSKLAFRKQPWLVALYFIEAALGALLPLAMAYLTGRLTTDLAEAVLTRSVPANNLYQLIIAIALLSLFRDVFSSFIRGFTRVLDDKMRLDMREEMLGKFSRLNFKDYEDREVLDQYDRTSGFANSAGWVFNRSTDLFGALVGVVASAIALLAVSKIIALCLFLSLLPVFIIRYRLQKDRYGYWRGNTTRRRIAAQAEGLVSNPKSIGEVRTLALVGHLLGISRKEQEEEMAQNQIYDKQGRRNDLAQSGMDSLVETGALLWVANQILYHGMVLGQFIFFQQVMRRFSGNISSVLRTFQALGEDVGKSYDFFEFMNRPEQKEGGAVLPKGEVPSIEFDKVWFKYPGEAGYALRDVSFIIQPGEKLALVGENGAGKSTLIKLMLGLYLPDKGTVRIGGQPTSELSLDSWLDHIGVLFQEFEHYQFVTIRENVKLGRISQSSQSNERVKEALRLAEVDYVENLPKGLDTFLSKSVDEEGGTSLSGGQWQRLALARNFYRNPSVLILDEPTSAIDARAEFKIFENVMKSLEGRTAVIVSHRFSTVRKADHILVLEHGSLQERGSHEELLALDGRYKELFEKQAAGYR